jgi:hypothetical protein
MRLYLEVQVEYPPSKTLKSRLLPDLNLVSTDIVLLMENFTTSG